MIGNCMEVSSEAVFGDRFGTTHKLIPGHRDQIKPGWARMLLTDQPAPTDAEYAVEMRGLTNRLELAERVLAAFGGTISGRDVLTVGCGDIIEPMFLAAWGAQSVVGIDCVLAGEDSESARAERCARTHIKEIERGVSPKQTVTLAADDITAPKQSNASFDLVCSWRTLEHITNPKAAFAEMFRILRPGGLAYHEYNPFFAIDGGHSLVTLDIPWGHVRFDREDITSYLTKFRPQEKSRALAYFDNCLNRMTLADLHRFAMEAGFEILTIVPRTRTEDLIKVNAELLHAAKRNHPSLTLNDLVSRIVRVVLRRPRNS